jgi:hypothetical protein
MQTKRAGHSKFISTSSANTFSFPSNILIQQVTEIFVEFTGFIEQSFVYRSPLKKDKKGTHIRNILVVG